MIPIEHERLVHDTRMEFTGGFGEYKESMAPLICNTANSDYGRLVEIRGLILYKHSRAISGASVMDEWVEEYDKTLVTCGDEFITIYLHQNYRESTPENIGRIALAWIKEYNEKKEG